MRSRQKFCDVAVYLPTGLFDVLAAGAEAHGVPWHVAYRDLENELRRVTVREAERLIQEYAIVDTAPASTIGNIGLAVEAQRDAETDD